MLNPTHTLSLTCLGSEMGALFKVIFQKHLPSSFKLLQTFMKNLLAAASNLLNDMMSFHITIQSFSIVECDRVQKYNAVNVLA